MAQKHPLTKEEFDQIFGKVPRLTVEVLINTPEGIVMTKIHEGVLKGKWYIPGGTVRFGEHLTDAVRRVAESELGIEVNVGDNIGYIEYPEIVEAGYRGWPVGMVFETTIKRGELSVNDEGEEVRCFKATPPNTVESQADFLGKYLSKKT